MTNNITYNQYIDIFEDIQYRHPQINDFYTGDIKKLGDDKELKYPVLCVYPLATTLEVGQDNYLTVKVNSFNIVVGDIVQKDESNQTDILSDCEQIIMDIISEINQDRFYKENGISITVNDINPFFERYDDVLSGWVVNINLKSRFHYKPCTSPSPRKINEKIIGRC